MSATLPFKRLALAGLGVCVLAACDTTSPPRPPEPPAVLTAAPRSDHEVTLDWGLADDKAKEVQLERANGAGGFTLLTTLASSATSYVDASLSAATTYQYRVRACNDGGCSAYAGPVSVSTFATLRITTTQLPDAVRGQPYGAGLDATGADSVYTWFVDAGSLPAGLTMTNLGIIAGTPGTEQIARFTARVRSGDGQTASRDFSLTVAAPATGPTFTIHNVVLPPALSNQIYQPQLSTEGGDGTAVSWTIVSGSLPSGVTMSSSGGFTGRATAVGTYTITVRASSASGRTATKTFSIAVVADDTGRFNITRLDVSAVPSNIAPHVAAAIARWESVIRGDLVRDDIPRGYLSAQQCAGFGDATNGTSVDDVIILVNIAPIDGPRKILGQASPCLLRDNVLTMMGALTLDVDDLASYAGSQTLTDILFHEIGHILGFGTLWAGFDCPPSQGFTACWSYLTGAGGTDPRFSGPRAVAEWQALGGTGTVPVENEGGSGTADSHWRETIFKNEIMTGFVSALGATNPLSRVSIASMADLGYLVDYAAADAFTITAPAGIRAPDDATPWEEVGREPIVQKGRDGRRRTLPR